MTIRNKSTIEEIPLNTAVECLDGLCGRSTRLVVDPETEQIRYIVVKQNRTPYVEYLIPPDFIMEILHNLIRLRCDQETLTKQTPFIEAKYVQMIGSDLRQVGYVALSASENQVKHEGEK